MKPDKFVFIALAVLIVLVGLLIYFSIVRASDLKRVNSLISQLQAPEKVDYDRIDKQIQADISGKLNVLPKAIDGNNGSTGGDGTNGRDGKSAYDLWVESGNTGSLQDFLSSLKGQRGDPGYTPELRLNKDTGTLETKLPIDTLWQIVPTVCMQGGC